MAYVVKWKSVSIRKHNIEPSERKWNKEGWWTLIEDKTSTILNYISFFESNSMYSFSLPSVKSLGFSNFREDEYQGDGIW